jgi:dynein intermediate chain
VDELLGSRSDAGGDLTPSSSVPGTPQLGGGNQLLAAVRASASSLSGRVSRQSEFSALSLGTTLAGTSAGTDNVIDRYVARAGTFPTLRMD